MPKKPAPRAARRTVLVIVEGDTEFAFCLHLKANLSRGRNIQINIRNAHGGSPDKIVAFASGEIRQASYDSLLLRRQCPFLPVSLALPSERNGVVLSPPRKILRINQLA